MATSGVSKPYYAKYNYENGNVSYSGGGIMGKMTELDIEIETSEDNNLYGDNGVAEIRAACKANFTSPAMHGADTVSRKCSPASAPCKVTV